MNGAIKTIIAGFLVLCLFVGLGVVLSIVIENNPNQTTARLCDKRSEESGGILGGGTYLSLYTSEGKLWTDELTGMKTGKTYTFDHRGNNKVLSYELADVQLPRHACNNT